MNKPPVRPARHSPITYTQARPVRGKRLYDDRRWRTVSKQFLHKHPMCRQCELLGTHEPATCVDHIIPHRGNQTLFWEQGNWQPLCDRCHGIKTAAETLGVATVPTIDKLDNTIITLLCGPPGSGRLAYAHAHMNDGDIIIDQASIAAQLAQCPRHAAPFGMFKAALAERNARLRSIDSGCAGVWVIVEAPRFEERRELTRELGISQVIVFQTEAEECAASVDPQARENVRSLAQDWWKRYTRGRDEQTIGY